MGKYGPIVPLEKFSMQTKLLKQTKTDNLVNNPLRDLHSDKCFDDEGDLFFAHMGRGTPKAKGIYNQKGKTYPEEWINYAEHYVL